MNVLISIYTDMLLSLSQGNYRGNISLSKPIFILSILESINKGDIKDNEITLNNIDLTNTFAGLYNHYNENINGLKSSSFLNPFFHLATSDFYHLIWKEGVKQPPMSSTPSGKYLRENLLYAKLDDELWDLLQDAENREFLKHKIINNYLTNK